MQKEEGSKGKEHDGNKQWTAADWPKDFAACHDEIQGSREGKNTPCIPACTAGSGASCVRPRVHAVAAVNNN